MALDVDTLFDAMSSAGEGLAGNLWQQMQSFAIPELKKIATQIVAIQTNMKDYTPDGAKALLDMQVHATIAVIAGMTELTLLDVQQAINAILGAIQGMVNKALGFALIA